MIARIYVVISCAWEDDLIIIQQTTADRKIVGKADFTVSVLSYQINVILSSYSAFNTYIMTIRPRVCTAAPMHGSYFEGLAID